MEKEIKVKILDHNPGDMWQSSNYPGTGIYEIPQDEFNFAMIGAAGAIWFVPKTVFNPYINKSIKSQGASLFAPGEIDSLIKIIAVTRDPKLAKSLTEKE